MTTLPNIPDAAVEAAVDALVMTRMGDYNIDMPSFRTAARQVLEAAAPHLMAQAWDEGCYEGLEWRPEQDYKALEQNPYRSAGADA